MIYTINTEKKTIFFETGTTYNEIQDFIKDSEYKDYKIEFKKQVQSFTPTLTGIYPSRA